MKKSSIQFAILLPIGIVLSIGVIFLVSMSGLQSAKITNRLSNEVIIQTVRYYSQKLNASFENAVGALNAVVPMTKSFRNTENGREAVLEVFLDIVEDNEGIDSLWTIWNANAFDGKDAQYRNQSFYNGTGQFVANVYRTSLETIDVDTILDYDQIIIEPYKDLLNQGKAFHTNPYEYNGQMLYSYIIPIQEKNHTIGMVGIDVNISKIEMELRQNRILNSGYVFMINTYGYFTAHPDETYILKHYRDTWLGNFQDNIEAILLSGGVYQGLGWDRDIQTNELGRESILTIESIPIGDAEGYWAVCGVLPSNVATSSALYITFINSFIGLIIIVIVGLLICWIVQRKLRNLSALTVAAKSLAKGEIDKVEFNSSIDPSSNNEIDILELEFSEMVRSIRQQITAAQKMSDGDLTVEITPRSPEDLLNVALAQMVAENNSIFHNILVSGDTVRAGAEQMTDSAQLLAQAAVDQNTAVEQLLLAISEIENKAVKNDGLADEAFQVTDKTKKIVEDSSIILQEMIESIEQINIVNNDIANAVETINGLAFQTNILSLNAAVEAAHAGRNAHGFAVIANEVRDLADKSAIATKNISRLVESSIQRATLGKEVAHETYRTLVAIIENMNKTHEIVNQIPVSSMEQVTAIHEISTEIQQVSTAAQQNSAVAEECAATSEELQAQINVLQNRLKHFRLNKKAQGGLDRSN